MARPSTPNARDPMEETPKGTWTILLLYTAVIVALWGYSYLELLLRR